MALVVLILQDRPDGTVNVHASFDPVMPMDGPSVRDEDATNAQSLAATLLAVINEYGGELRGLVGAERDGTPVDVRTPGDA